VVVGLPYPNPNDVLLNAKCSQLVTQLKELSSSSSRDPANMPAVKSEYLENLCMRAVNQSIGRAIRHRTDYAVMILADARYLNAGIQKKLPGWLRAAVVGRASEGVSTAEPEANGSFPSVLKHVSAFFRIAR